MIKNKYPTIKPSLNLDFENTKSLDPRVTFRRGTPGTYYDGVTHAKAEENLVEYSYAPGIGGDNWDSINMNVTGNVATSPDGTETAFRLSPTTSGQTSAILTGVAKTEQSHTWSIYAKIEHADYSMIALYWNGSGAASVVFDLSTGTVRNTKHGTGVMSNQTITAVGDGWYRCSCTYTGSTSTQATCYVIDSGATFGAGSWNFALNNSPVDGVAGMLVWGPQIEIRDFVTPYTATNGAPVTRYQPQLMTAAADRARFDHDPLTGESKGLLIEESRTNLLNYSQQIEQQATDASHFNRWIISSSSSNGLLDLNASIAPDGTLSASKFYASANGEFPGLYQQVYYTDTTPETLTFSVFAKAGQTNRYLQLFSGSGDVDGDPFANFNLFDGTISRDDSSIASIEDHGNGWYRCVITFTTVSTSEIPINPVIYLIDDDNAERGPQITGDNYSGLYVWGAQLETGSFATSYIKTTDASATRSADDVSIVGENFSSWYRQDQGSIVASASIDMNKRKGGTGMPVYNILKDTTALFGLSRDWQYWYHGIVNNNESTYKYSSDSESATGALTYDFSDGYLHSYVDQFENLSSTTWTWRETPFVHEHANTLRLGTTIAGNSGSNNLNGHIKKLAYYPQRLTNEQLQNLTR